MRSSFCVSHFQRDQAEPLSFSSPSLEAGDLNEALANEMIALFAAALLASSALAHPASPLAVAVVKAQFAQSLLTQARRSHI